MRTIDQIIDDIVCCADEQDGGKVDARRYCDELIVAVALLTIEEVSADARHAWLADARGRRGVGGRGTAHFRTES